jgi:hypothetical protein
MARARRINPGVVVSVAGILAIPVLALLVAYVSVDRYTDDKIRVELFRIYNGHRLNGVWKPMPLQTEKDLKGWQARWEKHGYRFLADGPDLHVLGRGGREVATVHNGESVQLH